MREIKFRAWGKNIKEYLSQDGVEPYAYTLKDISDGCIYDIDGFTIEQYTGLKDKNGKEIYEGDIVKQSWFNGDDGDITIIGVVGFNEEEASFGIVQTIKRTNEQYSGFYSQREVIGNIHENSKLLENL